jgi:hypothetical protein
MFDHKAFTPRQLLALATECRERADQAAATARHEASAGREAEASFHTGRQAGFLGAYNVIAAAVQANGAEERALKALETERLARTVGAVTSKVSGGPLGYRDDGIDRCDKVRQARRAVPQRGLGPRYCEPCDLASE